MVKKRYTSLGVFIPVAMAVGTSIISVQAPADRQRGRGKFTSKVGRRESIIVVRSVRFLTTGALAKVVSRTFLADRK